MIQNAELWCTTTTCRCIVYFLRFLHSRRLLLAHLSRIGSSPFFVFVFFLLLLSFPFADDFVRHLHSFHYTFLKETDGDNYPRFAMYTLGGDNYNFVQFPLFAYGMGEQSVLDSLSIQDVILDMSDFRYTDYYQVDAPKGCSQGGSGSSSCWFAMLTNPSLPKPDFNNIDQRSHRGVIVRNFHGQLNGEPWPPADGEEVSPFTFNLIKSRGNNAGKNTVSIELGLPSAFIAAVDAGQAKFREGDYLEADIELLLPPRQTADYFGKSQRLKDWLSEADVDTNYEHGWKIIAKEADMGDAIETTVFQGALERAYHPRIHVDFADEARFDIEIPDGMPGILPITIAGVGAFKSFPTTLLGRPNEKLWRYVNGVWKEFGVGGDYQLEKDVLDNSYTFVYSLQLEFESDPVGNREQFAFGATAPFDTNDSQSIRKMEIDCKPLIEVPADRRLTTTDAAGKPNKPANNNNGRNNNSKANHNIVTGGVLQEDAIVATTFSEFGISI